MLHCDCVDVIFTVTWPKHCNDHLHDSSKHKKFYPRGRWPVKSKNNILKKEILEQPAFFLTKNEEFFILFSKLQLHKFISYFLSKKKYMPNA